MDIQYIVTIVYFLLGFVLSYYWFARDYEEEYKKSVEEETVEKGIGTFLLLLMTVFWPIVLIKNIIRYKTL